MRGLCAARKWNYASVTPAQKVIATHIRCAHLTEEEEKRNGAGLWPLTEVNNTLLKSLQMETQLQVII
ncbi:hypothetical protein KOW79_022100 [Hemibagrus wyckioides]|uniref:Uncharacterized protein n=1 Tax=Hemibagrus wyckioides TaxID=337641 RepID=A0A9D3S8P5_9TELE|nr:hypothetical protein KOW79_022100 [Hemibagrus wyckioides]